MSAIATHTDAVYLFILLFTMLTVALDGYCVTVWMLSNIWRSCQRLLELQQKSWGKKVNQAASDTCDHLPSLSLLFLVFNIYTDSCYFLT